MMDYVILVGSNNAHALVEFTRFTKTLTSELSPLCLKGLSLVDAVASRGLVEANSPCNVTIGIAGDRWVTMVLSFLAMTLATVGGFVNASVDKVFIMPGEEGEPVDWPIVPRLVDLSLVGYRVLRLICSGHGLAKEVVKGYALKFNEAISLQAIGRVLAKLRGKGLVNSRPVGEALMHESTALGRLIACS